MRKAIIDLGTNTFNLLVADVSGKKFQVVRMEKAGVAIGMGGINSKIITPEAMDRSEKALAKFLQICSEINVSSVLAFGTSALRDAANSSEFINRLKENLKLDVHIISGEKEAELIYQGVKQVYNFDEKAVIIDIGGGSTEVVFADNNGVTDLNSLNIGVSRIYQKFNFQDPFSKADIESIIHFLEEESNGFFENRNEEIMIGSSGSFETFWELAHLANFPSEQACVEMDLDLFKQVLHEMIKSTMEEREKNNFIVPIRKLMGPITAVKTLWLIEKLQTKRIVISPFSLKEGALFSEEF